MEIRKTRWNLKKNGILYVMLIPAFALLAIFSYYPLYGLVIAFQNFMPGKGFWGSQWVGLRNFRMFFMMPDGLQVVRNTFVIAVSKIIFGNLTSIVFALLLNEVRVLRYKRMVQTLVYLPHFLSWVVVGGVFIDLLGSRGIVNLILSLFGAKPVAFLGNASIFPVTIVVTDIWKGFGWGAIIYLAALSNVDVQLYEAAIIDGANKWQQVFYITIPALLPTIAVVYTLALGNVLNAGFEQVLMLYNPVVYSTGDIIDTYTYRAGLEQFRYSYSAAVGMFKSVVAGALIILSYRLVYRYSDYRIF
ncbi:MAG: ABC transporter permease subunit [Clostridia bacterium]|nr:ABC transporter permease subunit [Clostridia bacterium]